ncbi:MAG TPA: YHYH domain-containing protein [Vampirovibrionales bacterium]
MRTHQLLTATLLALSLVSLADAAWSHGGRTDSSGCHNDRKNGGYHCHNSGSGSGSSPSAPSPAPSGGSSGGTCLTFDDCMSQGNAYMEANADRALNYFQQALTLQPNNVEAFSMVNILEPYVRQISGSCPDYTTCMNLGYTATNQKDYQTALVNFKRALAFDLGNEYALQAIRNVSRYIQEAAQAQ